MRKLFCYGFFLTTPDNSAWRLFKLAMNLNKRKLKSKWHDARLQNTIAHATFLKPDLIGR